MIPTPRLALLLAAAAALSGCALMTPKPPPAAAPAVTYTGTPQEQWVQGQAAYLAWSAARLLDSPDLVRLKACHCGRLFLDGSRNRSRRWCDKGECGNRANVARFRSRHR